MAKQDYYDILGVPRNASQDEIKKAYRTMAKKYHPDNNQGNAEAESKFKEVNEAHSTLSDPEKKARYDQFGHAASGMGGGGGGYGGGFEGFGGFDDLSDILRNMGFGGMGGGRGGRSRGPRPGSDIEVTIQVDFMDVITGVEKDVRVRIKDTCSTCKGNGAKPGTSPQTCGTCNGAGQVKRVVQTIMGYMETAQPCNTCEGKGKIIKEKCTSCSGQGRKEEAKTIVVKVPKGIENGQSIKYTNQGEAGEMGAPKGDLYIKVAIAPHKTFKRRGNDIHIEKSISYAQAALGATIPIDTPYGKDAFTVQPATQPGTITTLKGKGMPILGQQNRTGDLHITLKLVVPKSLSEKQKDLLRQFAVEEGDNMDGLGDGKKGFFGKRKK